MWFLRQSTASQEIPLGPLLDSTDGNTAETALSIANTDIKLFPTGATSEASKNSGGATHIASGRYYTVLDATDTATIGPMRVSCHVTGALAVWLDCCVLAANVYDVLFGTVAPSTHTAAAVQALVAAGAVASVTGNVGGNVVGSVGSVAGAVASVTAGVTLAASQHVIVDSGTVTTLTNLPTMPTDWLTAAGLSSGAVAEIQSGLMLAASYTAPDNAGIAAIQAKTDNLPSDPADQSLIITATDAVMTRLGVPVGASLSADIATRSSHSAADVWAGPDRTLTAFGFSVTLSGTPDVNVVAIHGTTLTGDGSAVPWGPA